MRFYKSIVARCFMIFVIVPVLIISIIMTIVSTNIVYKIKVDDTREMLCGAAKELVYSYELLAVDKIGFRDVGGAIFAGNVQVTDNYSIVDRIKEFTGADMSLFYMDTRVVTTLLNDDGSRYVDTKASDVWDNYVRYGRDYFDENIVINGKEYFGYYIPVHSSENIIIGMGFAGVPREDLRAAIRQLNGLAIGSCTVLCCVFLIICIWVSKKLLKMQNRIMEYLIEIDNGNFEHSMEERVYNRKDEYGIMGRYLVKLNDSLQKLIQRDVLTGLYNRRAAMQRLEHYVSEANRTGGELFTFAIGDIDFFKRVNDTYGHSCGDIVLKSISDVLNSIPDDEGFVARWGGEEFVIVFKGRLEENLPKLEIMADRIRNTTVEYGERKISVTMTFGVVEYKPPGKLDLLISNADVLLYKGKENGRNTIVS